MSPKKTTVSTPVAQPVTPPSPKKKRKWLVCGCITLVVIFIILCIGAGIFVYYVYQDVEEQKEIENLDRKIMGEDEPKQEELDDGQLYDINMTYSFDNNGPSTITRAEIYIALIQDNMPYQEIIEESVASGHEYELITDNYGNKIAKFNIESITANTSEIVTLNYKVKAYKIKNYLGNCQGEVIDDYLESEKYIESDNQEIIDLANQITAGKTNHCEKAMAIYEYIGDNITYEVTKGDYGALHLLQTKIGDCTCFTDLFNALARASGIPARNVDGMTYKKEKDYTNTNMTEEEIESDKNPLHAWSEVYLPGTGWTPVDTTWGQKSDWPKHFSRTDGQHVKFTIGKNNMGEYMLRDDVNFHYSTSNYWWNGQQPNVEIDTDWTIDLAD